MPHPQQYQAAVDPGYLEHRVNQRSLVLTVSEAPSQDSVHPIGLVAVDSKFQGDVAGIADHEMVDCTNHFELIGSLDPSQALVHRSSDLVVRSELIANQSPVVATYLLPGFVSGNVKCGNHFRPSGHRRLRNDLAAIREHPSVERPSIELFLNDPKTRRSLRFVPIQRPLGGHIDDVLVSDLRACGLDVVNISPVIRKQVVLRGILDAVLEFEDVADAQPWERKHACSGVVIHPRPRLVDAPFALRVTLDGRTVGLGDARPDHLDLLAVWRIGYWMGAKGLHSTLGVDLHRSLLES